MFYGPKSVLALLCCNLTHVCTRDKHLDSVSLVNAYCRLLSWPPATVNTFWIRFWEMLKFKRHGSQRICPTNASKESCSRNDPEYLKPEKRRRRRRRRSEKKIWKAKMKLVVVVFFVRSFNDWNRDFCFFSPGQFTPSRILCERVCVCMWCVLNGVRCSGCN